MNIITDKELINLNIETLRNHWDNESEFFFQKWLDETPESDLIQIIKDMEKESRDNDPYEDFKRTEMLAMKNNY